MPSFDVVSKVDPHELSNAVDQAVRELDKRYDLRGTGARFVLQDYLITQYAQSEFQLSQLLDILRLRLGARGIDAALHRTRRGAGQPGRGTPHHHHQAGH